MPLRTDSTRLPPTHHHRLRPGVTCTPPPRPPPPKTPRDSSRTGRRHVHDEHRDVVVLLVTSEHTFHEVLEEPFGAGQQLLVRPGGHRGQLFETSVQTTIPVLYQTVRIKNRRTSGAQVERVLFPRAGPAQRRARLHLIEARSATCLKNKGRQVARIPQYAGAGLRVDDQIG